MPRGSDRKLQRYKQGTNMNKTSIRRKGRYSTVRKLRARKVPRSSREQPFWRVVVRKNSKNAVPQRLFEQHICCIRGCGKPAEPWEILCKEHLKYYREGWERNEVLLPLSKLKEDDD